MELTSYQQTVASHNNSHALCIAVAGSGKTTTLSHLVQSLLINSADPRRVMVMMFNKSAQLDFNKKLKKTCRNHPLLPKVRTYHSTGLRLLRTLESWNIRAPYNKKPLSDKEVELKIRGLILALAPESVKDKMRSDAARYIEAVVSFIDNTKSNLITPEQMFEQTVLPDEYHFFIRVFEQFEFWRHQQQRITFTDMLYDPMCLVRQQPELVQSIENKMDYIVVDEYQDTSTLQHQFTRLIAGSRARVIAVGDPDQTIYEFAGANIDNILKHFQKDFSATGDVKELTLPHTFRYGHSIALAASHLISKNNDRKNVLCLAHEENQPSLIRINQQKGDDCQALITAIKEYLAAGNLPENIAILVRVWAQAVNIELSLLEEGIPYISDGPSVFLRPEIETLICALKMAGGLMPLYEADVRGQLLMKMLTLPHLGIKNQLIQQIVSQLQVLETGYGRAMEAMAQKIPGISDYQINKIKDRAQVLHFLEGAGQTESAVKLLITYIQQTELYDSLRSMSLNDQRTEEQILAVKGFQTFMKQLDRDARTCCHHIDTLIERQRKRNTGKSNADSNNKAITLSSCHRAKGLEWPVVLLPGLTRQYWPFIREDDLSTPSGKVLEAERRLLYVAMTRTKQQLHLFTCPGSLEKPDTDWSRDRSQCVSPFLLEINIPHILELGNLIHEKESNALTAAFQKTGLTSVSRRYLAAARPELSTAINRAPDWQKVQLNHFQTTIRQSPSYRAAVNSATTVASDEPWQLKARIEHSIFGIGRVTQVNDTNFMVSFENRQFGVKRFARHPDVKHLFCRAD